MTLYDKNIKEYLDFRIRHLRRLNKLDYDIHGCNERISEIQEFSRWLEKYEEKDVILNMELNLKGRDKMEKIKLNYMGKLYVVNLDFLAKQVDLFGIIEIQDFFNGNQAYDCYDVEGNTIDKNKPIPIELYNKQINISYGAGSGG